MRRICSLLCVALAAPTGTASAQSAHTVTLRLDNDAYNFWRTPGDRPDEEYTNGVRLTYETGASPWWARALAKSLPACTLRTEACAARTFEFGQDMYTPRRTHDSTTAPAGSRPNAGWLYVSESARILRRSRADDYTIVLGVTGPPALAQFTQRIAHSFAPAFNRPTDWSQQVAFEPGVILRYQQSRRAQVGAAGPVSFDVLPRALVEAGNISTAAEAGLRARAGLNMRHPWLPAAQGAPAELVLTLGAAVRGVARDLFLDGSSFQSGPRVGHESFTHTADWSLTFRHRALTLTYGAVTQSREYATGPATHTWSSMAAALTFLR